MTLQEAIKQRHSVRRYVHKPLSADIIETGIYLTGGSSAINRLGELINGETELHVNIADNPSECVVKGIKTIIDDEKYNEIAYIPKDRIID